MEEWRPIPDHDGYECSNEGRVRSLDRWVMTRRGHSRFKRGQILSVRIDETAARHADRYPHVMLGRGRMRRVHQLVAWTFIGPQPEGFYVCHRDGDRTNNRPSNLYYGTARENQLDRRLHGGNGVGSKHHCAVLNEEQIQVIRKRLDAGELQREIAIDYGVSQSAISNIKTGTRWSHVEG